MQRLVTSVVLLRSVQRLFSQTPQRTLGQAVESKGDVNNAQPQSKREGKTPRVTELRYNRQRRALSVSFDNQAKETFSLPAEYLRVFSPSAEVQGHSPTQKKVVSGRRFVGVTKIEPVGHYAVRSPSSLLSFCPLLILPRRNKARQSKAKQRLTEIDQQTSFCGR